MCIKNDLVISFLATVGEFAPVAKDLSVEEQ